MSNQSYNRDDFEEAGNILFALEFGIDRFGELRAITAEEREWALEVERWMDENEPDGIYMIHIISNIYEEVGHLVKRRPRHDVAG